MLIGDALARELQSQVARKSTISIPVAAFHAYLLPSHLHHSATADTLISLET